MVRIGWFALASPILLATTLFAQDTRTVTYPLPNHAAQLPRLPRLRQSDRRIHRVGREDHDAEDGAQHRRHRPRLIAQRHHHAVLSIDKPDIQLRSANPDASKTVVVMDKSAGTSGGTLHSATVNVTGVNFFAENITFQNDWNAHHDQLPAGSQALALLVRGDRDVFHNVRLLGNQDTLFTGSKECTGDGDQRRCTPARQYFSDCYIEVNVDFIFGDGKTVFDHCEIRSTPHSEGFVTAQGKSYADEDSGYVFHACKLTADPEVDNVYLGRPWRPYASVVYLDTEMGAYIQPAGRREWHPGETHSLDTAFYAEGGSTGPGARTSAREPHSKQLTAEEAKKFVSQNFLGGSDNWDPTAPLKK